jgi:Ni/Co efflux regulator RcnB
LPSNEDRLRVHAARGLLSYSGEAGDAREGSFEHRAPRGQDARSTERGRDLEEDPMKSVRLLILVVAVAALSASLAAAGTATPRVDRRQVRQHVRIHDGVRSGELTRGEAMRLRADQRHIRRVERRAKSDGVVTPGERARLDNIQDRESRRIYRLKHNQRSR